MKPKVSLKKMITTIGLLAVVSPIALTVVACGPNVVERDPAKDLNTIFKIKEVNGDVANTKDSVLNKIIDLNQESKITEQDVEIKDFEPASYNFSGSAKIVAKLNSKYTGEVDIIIKFLAQIDLNDVIKNRIVDGNIANDEYHVMNAIAVLNREIWGEDIEVKDLNPATYSEDGSAKVFANNPKYFGEVDIIITKLLVTNQEIVSAINSTQYSITIEQGSAVTELVAKVDDINFIKNKLTDPNIINAIDNDSFKFNKVTVSGRDLTDLHLANVGSVEAEINYSYAGIEGKAKLLITIENNKLDISDVNLSGYGAYSINVNGESVQAMRKWVMNVFTGSYNKQFVEAVTKVIGNEDIAKDMSNYQVEWIYFDKTATNPINWWDIINNRLFFAKVVGVNKLKGWFTFSFQTTS